MDRPKRPSKKSVTRTVTPLIKTLLVDGEVLLKRSFAGSKQVNTEHGRIKTVYMFLDGLRRLIVNNAVSKVVVCWEGENSRAIRQDYYQFYKKNRDEVYTEEERYDLGRQRMIIRQCLEELYIRQVSEDFCEGDDVIAYYCLNSPNEDKLIFTIDQDLLQLLNEDVQVYLSNKKQIITRDSFIRDWGYPPENIPLVKTIVGDTADNISGIQGIGPKKFFKYFPDTKKGVKTIEWLLSESAKNFEEEPDNTDYKNILECVTKFGHHGNEYHHVIHKIINLRQPLLPDHAMVEVNEAINGVLDTEGRKGVSGVRKLALDFGFYNFFTKNDDLDLVFWQPFTMLITRERMLSKISV